MSTTATSNRFETAEALRTEAARCRAEIREAVSALRPIGVLSELAAVTGARPRRGVAVSVPTGGTYVFARDRRPSQAQLYDWDTLWKHADQLDRQALDLSAWGIVDPGCTIGNRHYLAAGQRLRDAGLLTDTEVEHLAALEAFWNAHPDDETGNRTIGVVADDGSIVEHR